MFALISRILNLSGRYKSRIQAAFLCAFVESILSKMPIFMAFIVLAGFADNTLTGKTCLFVGLGLFLILFLQWGGIGVDDVTVDCHLTQISSHVFGF